MIKVLRFIGAVVLAFIATLAIRYLALMLFGGTAMMIRDFSFWNLVLYMVALSIGGAILSFVAPLLMSGLTYTVQGSKFIAIIVILVFLNHFGNECVYFLGENHLGYYSDNVLETVKAAAGAFYKAGAIITLIIEFFCYGFLSLFLFINPNE